MSKLVVIPYDSYLTITNNKILFPLYFEESQEIKHASFDDLLNKIRFLLTHDKLLDIFHPETYPTLEAVNSTIEYLIERLVVTPSCVKQITIRSKQIQKQRLLFKEKSKEKVLYPGIAEIEKQFILIAYSTQIRFHLTNIVNSKMMIKQCS